MAITTTQVTQLCDSISQGISDFNTAFVTNTSTSGNIPYASTIISGVAGTGATSALLGRALNLNDLASELLLLPKANTVAGNVTAYINSIRSLSSYYQQYFPILDALDLATSGLNAYLIANSLMVTSYFATAFNAYQALSIALGYRTTTTVPTALSSGVFFPAINIDSMWSFTSSSATAFSSNTVGSNSSTAVVGGGIGQFYLYKSNATNASGGATFTISYLNATGATMTATYSTTAGTPAASGSLASGYVISGAIGSAITGVTGTGMTSGESYTIGIKPNRSTVY